MSEESKKADEAIVREKFESELRGLVPNIAKRAPLVFQVALDHGMDREKYASRPVDVTHELLHMEKLLMQIEDYKIGGSRGPR